MFIKFNLILSTEIFVFKRNFKKLLKYRIDNKSGDLQILTFFFSCVTLDVEYRTCPLYNCA